MSNTPRACPCGEPLPVPHGRGGPPRTKCDTCRRARCAQHSRDYRAKNPDLVKGRDLAARYGITIEDYKRQLEQQVGVCAICQEPEPINGRSLAVDHCHSTGKVRGLLCHACNTAIGKLKDSPALLRVAALYLENPPYADA